MLIIFQDNLSKFYARQQRLKQAKLGKLTEVKRLWFFTTPKHCEKALYFFIFAHSLKSIVYTMRSVITLLCVNIIMFKCDFF